MEAWDLNQIITKQRILLFPGLTYKAAYLQTD